MQRAAIFKDAEQIANPQRRTRALRALVDSARSDGLLMPVLAAIQPLINEIQPAPEISWFALTAIEASLVGGDYESVLPWLALARSSDRVFEEPLHHWRVLADVANPKTAVGQTDLFALEEMVARGRISGPVLRRLDERARCARLQRADPGLGCCQSRATDRRRQAAADRYPVGAARGFEAAPVGQDGIPCHARDWRLYGE